MALVLPDLPAEFSEEWLAWAAAIHSGLMSVSVQLDSVTPPSGFIATINGLPPGVGGDYPLTADMIDALSSGYTPSVSDLPLTVIDLVLKSAGGTGVWPTAYAANGTADYTDGTDSTGKRPHGLAASVVWLGYPPYPPTVDSGDGGMLRGFDQTATPEP